MSQSLPLVVNIYSLSFSGIKEKVFVVFRMNCPCVINAAENSPELDEIKQINLQYQVGFSFLFLFLDFLTFKHFKIYFFHVIVAG